MRMILLSRQARPWKRVSCSLLFTVRPFSSNTVYRSFKFVRFEAEDEAIWTPGSTKSARKRERLRSGVERYLQPEFEPRKPGMKSSVSILTTPTADTNGTALVLHFEDKKYLFGNIHEGLQRVCLESGTRLAKLSNLFLTGRTEWRTTGGVVGFLLTLADVVQMSAASQKEIIEEQQARWESKRAALVLEQAKKSETAEQRPKDKKAALAAAEQIKQMDAMKQPKDKLEHIPKARMTIHGSDNISQLIATTRKFIFRRGMPVDIHEYADKPSTTTPTYEDGNIQVWAMPLEPATASTSQQPPRKRSYDDYLEMPGNNSDQPMSRDEMLQGIITDMFDSTWRHDALVESKMSEVDGRAELFTRDPDGKGLKKYTGPRTGQPGLVNPNMKVLVRKPWPGATRVRLPETTPSQVCMSYIVRTQPRAGKFDPAAAKKLGVKPGPEFSALSRGESVINAAGETITPDQVTGPPPSPAGFAVVELPTADYIDSLRSSAAFTSQDAMKGIGAIFWILGPGVSASSEFQKLVTEHASLEHIVTSADHCPNHFSMDSAASAQWSHRIIDEERFSIPLYNNNSRELPPALSKCIIGKRGMELSIAPAFKFEATMDPAPLNLSQVAQKTTKAVTEFSERAHREIQGEEFQAEYQAQKLPAQETEIITLGTGSAVPSKQRNVSATLVRIPGVGSYLLDCGENTLGQLARLYSPEELKVVLKDLKLIWISHMHADHHLGTVSVIRAWHTAVHGDPEKNVPPELKGGDILNKPAKYLVNERKLCIVSCQPMLSWLEEYSEIEQYGYGRIIPMCAIPATFNEHDRLSLATQLKWKARPIGFNGLDPGLNVAMRKATGLANLQAVAVQHCHGARAVTLYWPSGLKISYSGDCRPSKHFAAIGKGSTVLIHEATFDDELAGDAIAKKHSTTREAIGVGLEMGAKRIILTHFSQRYSKVPELGNIVAKPVRFEDSHEKPEDDDAGVIPDGEHTDDIDDAHVAAALEGALLPSTDPEPAKFSPLPAAPASPSRTQRLTPTQAEAAKDLHIGVAFDSMRVKIKDIMLLSKFKAAFAKLYAEPENASEEKKARVAAGEAQRLQKLEAKKERQEKQQAKMKSKGGSRDSSRPSSAMDVPAEVVAELGGNGLEKAAASAP